ncbi:MAG: TetM/TetW/TetO/TetS family tetracycline resistance ribosomal protection protein, partial [Chloroflexia bacterium]|nr:TetM/TetW/TetO/TetS family tetracycline resistance ribosomal protection protein [Chloroflexia bacterium]
LTERILYHAGVIREIGSVDQGTTQTDTLELERRRGITIQSAIVSFRIGDLKVNLIDTPGHPDFIAEVERALGVLDGVILVVSAVEGVQSQTRRLAQALETAQIPFLIFANKIDRRGARDHDLLDEIGRKLRLRVIPINAVSGIGSSESMVSMRAVDDPETSATLINLLTETSDDLLNAYLRNDGRVNASVLEAELVRQVHERIVTPVVFGSAVTGAGLDHVVGAIERFLPAACGRADDPLSGVVFKIQRARSGEKLVLVRIFSGSVENRQNVTFLRPSLNGEPLEYDDRITGIERFDQGRQEVVASARTGDIVRLHGLKETSIGDVLGQPPSGRPKATFTPPVLESVVSSHDPALRPQLNVALAELADQDPLINISRDNHRGSISVYLYGDVQKEVIASTLADDYGVDAEFQPSTLVCVETPLGSGSAIEVIGTPENPFQATVGLRVEPGERGSGVTYSRNLGLLPLSFYTAIEETVYATLEEGLRGWRVIDCHVTLTDVAMNPISAAGDFRSLTPLVVMEALRAAGTAVMEPVERFLLEVPEASLGAVLAAVGTSRGVAEEHEICGTQWRITGRMPTEAVHAFEQRLPDVSRGEGDLSTRFDSWAPIPGDVPSRPRTDFNPLNRKLYLAQVSQA